MSDREKLEAFCCRWADANGMRLVDIDVYDASTTLKFKSPSTCVVGFSVPVTPDQMYDVPNVEDWLWDRLNRSWPEVERGDPRETDGNSSSSSWRDRPALL